MIRSRLVLRQYFKNLYQRTMDEAYGLASREIMRAVRTGGACLDCGAHSGYWYDRIFEQTGMDRARYYGIDWNRDGVEKARKNGLNVVHGSLNDDLPFENEKFNTILALSVLEHLINGCHFLQECHRVLKKKGSLILITPNISTYFTAALILLGRMPSTGPHPDSTALVKEGEVFRVSSDEIVPDPEANTPVFRHLVVFSYRDLKKYLQMTGFSRVDGHGFGLYPFPKFIQPALEKIDPYHCHQMVFTAVK